MPTGSTPVGFFLTTPGCIHIKHAKINFLRQSGSEMHVRHILLYCLFVHAAAVGDVRAVVASESRDAAAAYILTQNFVIGRSARECFELLQRSDTPGDFVAGWQKRNARYYLAALNYMNRRLHEADAQEGSSRAVAIAARAAIEGDGTGAVGDFFREGDKPAVCTRLIPRMEKGDFDIGPQSPMHGELDALVAYIDSTPQR